MTILEAIVLGLLQGLTEFIPVSSSGHLVIGQYLFSGSSDHLFLEWINVGTLLALVVFFRKRIEQLWVAVVGERDLKLLINIFVAAIPAGLVGLLFSGTISEAGFFGSIFTVVCSLFLVGLVMVLLERLPKASLVASGGELTAKRALLIGVVQVFALIPGVSRSGSTIIAGRLMGLTPAHAAEFSFLVSLPIMMGVVAKLFIGGEGRQYLADNFGVLVVGNLVAFIFGLLAVGFLMRYLSKHGLSVFGWYRMALALAVLVLLLLL